MESQHPVDCQEAVALVEDVTWISEEEGKCNGRVERGSSVGAAWRMRELSSERPQAFWEQSEKGHALSM